MYNINLRALDICLDAVLHCAVRQGGSNSSKTVWYEYVPLVQLGLTAARSPINNQYTPNLINKHWWNAAVISQVL